MIVLEKLSKIYGRTKAVTDIDLTVKKGEIFGFIGPNGAGKTTTIKMMSGLLLPTKGRVRINGVDMAKEPEKAKKHIGLIPDRPYLYEKLTGMEFMAFTAELYETGMNHFHERATDLLKRFSILDHSNDMIESYSHGMKQRLIMASALFHKPPLLIVDEPMVGLDPKGIRMVRSLFRGLAEQGTTIFMSTHTLNLAEDVCDRIGIINDGRLIATGTIPELKHAAKMGEGNLEALFFQLTEEITHL
ncbi:MAG: ABC transporter ATP-binding protein [Proteobacteria bacterium]|nr:ABC transporter ATP-binding protein [Pseudomonadota bacterium]